MLRPMPHVIRGRRSRRARPEKLGLGCPKICPEWQWGAIRALIKPQYKDAIRHRSSEQPWPRDAKRVMTDAAQIIRAKLGTELTPHFPPAGDYHFLAEVPAADLEAAKGLAVLISRRLPELWFTLGRWYVRDGRFYRKHRGYNILLKPASNVHLTRATWNALRGEF